MGFVYAGLWAVIALVLIVRFRKESRAVLPLSVYFFFLGAWWAADELFAVDLMSSGYVWIVRCVSVVMFLYCGTIYYLERTGKIGKKGGGEEESDKESDG